MATTPRKTNTPAKSTAATKTARAKAPARTAATKTTAKATTPRKPAAPRATKSAAIASAEAAAPAPTVVSTTAPNVAIPEMKKKDLIDAVVERSGTRKKLAKPVIEAMLAILGEELAKGRELNLNPLGKVKINRIKQMAGGRIVMCKLRQSEHDTPDPDDLDDDDQDLEKDSADPLADAAE